MKYFAHDFNRYKTLLKLRDKKLHRQNTAIGRFIEIVCLFVLFIKNVKINWKKSITDSVIANAKLLLYNLLIYYLVRQELATILH